MQDKELNKRNFFGYGDTKLKINWPGNKKIALSIVVNIEEGAELSVSSGDSINEYIYENNKIKFESHEYFLYLEDVINLSDELNFEIVDIYGNYEMDPFIEDSDELIIIGKKKDVG